MLYERAHWKQSLVDDLTFHVTLILWEVTGCRITSIGGPSGSAERDCAKVFGYHQQLFDCVSCFLQVSWLFSAPGAEAAPGALKKKSWKKSRAERRLTRFLCANGEFFTGLALAYGIVRIHADAVDRGGVKVHNVCLVVGGGDVSSRMLQLPGICQKTEVMIEKKREMREKSVLICWIWVLLSLFSNVLNREEGHLHLLHHYQMSNPLF